MKTERQTRSRDAEGTQRSFSWAVRSTDIPFMETEQEASGASGCNCVGTDCGCGISKLDTARISAAPDARP